MLKSWKLWKARRQVIKELSALSDHELRDIGIHRGNIRDIAMSAVIPESKM